MNQKIVRQAGPVTILIAAFVLMSCGKGEKPPHSAKANTPSKQASTTSTQTNAIAEKTPNANVSAAKFTGVVAELDSSGNPKAAHALGVTGVVSIDLDLSGNTKQSGSNYCETAQIGTSGFILKVISNARGDFLKDYLPRLTAHPITRNNYTLQVTYSISAAVDLSRGYGAAVCSPECELVDNSTKSVIKKATFPKVMLGGSFERIVADVLAMLDEGSKSSSSSKAGEPSAVSDPQAGTDALGHVIDFCKAGEMQKAVTYSRGKTQSSPHDVNN